jgi:hypothetical protein
MLAFRSDANVDAWCDARGVERGAVFGIDRAWELAEAWYADRLSPSWRRPTVDEAQATFARVGLTGEFWALRG